MELKELEKIKKFRTETDLIKIMEEIDDKVIYKCYTSQQMDMYIRMFDDLKKQPDDNSTIGIILCTDKDGTMVKYSVLNDSEQIFASK